ncbi:hypothetical protein [Dickeya zeae]|uniref:hypothetical protein n=1 Tax=Dickeya zeae TaxID=204042 RepID=UPI00057770E7|nr:hypothetical protein [Dickeya zeae]
MSEYLPFIKNVEVMEFLGYPGLLALSCDLISEVLNSVSKRKTEYLAGRVMTMKGLVLLGRSESQVNIGKHRV